jgi:hypothetical protein
MAAPIQLPPATRNMPVTARFEASMFGVMPTEMANVFVALGAAGSSAGPAET